QQEGGGEGAAGARGRGEADAQDDRRVRREGQGVRRGGRAGREGERAGELRDGDRQVPGAGEGGAGGAAGAAARRHGAVHQRRLLDRHEADGGDAAVGGAGHGAGARLGEGVELPVGGGLPDVRAEQG